MAVTGWEEINDGRKSSEEQTGDKVVKRYTRMFRAITSKATDEGSVIHAYSQCPQYGDPHHKDDRAFCINVSPTIWSPQTKFAWRIAVRYSTEYELDDNPLAEPAKIRWNSESREVIAVKDISGAHIGPSSGESYDPPAVKDDSRWVVVISKNMAAIPLALLSYPDVVNAVAIIIDGVPIAKGSAKISGISIGEQQERNDIPFRVVTITVHTRPPIPITDPPAIPEDPQLNKVWWLYLKDEGFYRKVLGGGGDIEHILLPFSAGTAGKKCTTPVPLNGEGQPLQVIPATGHTFNIHQIYREGSYAGIIPAATDDPDADKTAPDPAPQ